MSLYSKDHNFHCPQYYLNSPAFYNDLVRKDDAVSIGIISYIDDIMIIPEAAKEARTNLNSMVTCKINRCLLINLRPKWEFL